MALQRGPAFYPRITQTDAPPAGVFDLADTASPPVLTSGTMSGATGVSAAATLFQIVPTSSTTMSTQPAASTQLANNVGWQIPPTTGVGGTTTDLRLLPSGSALAFTGRTVAVGVLGTTTVTFSLYKRSAGALSFIASGSYAATDAAAALNTDGTATITLASDVLLGPSETLYVECYVSVPGELAVAATAVQSFQGTAWTLSGPSGLGYRRLRSAADAASAVDAERHYIIRPRSVADTAPASDVTTRRFIGARTVTETAGASDSLGRVLILNRTVRDNIGGAVDYQGAGPNSKTISGIVYTGTLATAGAVCRLLRDGDDFLCGTFTTGADGAYSFARDLNDPNTYHVEVYVGAALHGLTDRGLVPT